MQNHNFYDSLAVGKSGEESFLGFIQENYPMIQITHLSNSEDDTLKKGADFLINGKKAEIKTNGPRYPLTAFFVELVSNTETGTVGALTKSILDGCTHYIYWDPRKKDLAIYDALELLRFVYNNLDGRAPKFATNEHYETQGYIFTREELKKLECSLTQSGISRHGCSLTA